VPFEFDFESIFHDSTLSDNSDHIDVEFQQSYIDPMSLEAETYQEEYQPL
jgi:hypothetical protein